MRRRLRSAAVPVHRHALPQIALDAGTTSIVQPGGSRRDEDVIAAVAKAGAAMALTGRRHFRH